MRQPDLRQPDLLQPDYDGRVFAAVRTPETTHGDASTGDAPRGHYHQRGDLVWAEFSGGKVRHGSLSGLCAPDGTLRFAYCQVLTDGTVIAGDCVSHPQRLADGRVRLREEWRRHSPRAERGVSYVDELRPAALPPGEA